MNPDHMSILSKGVAHWNKWRAENPGETPNFSRANLMAVTGVLQKKGNRVEIAKLNRPLLKGDSTPMHGIDLRHAMLAHACMERLILDDADLTGANLDGTFLNHASLRRAKLDGAFMQDANLRSADLTGASLRDVDLRRAVLVETNFSGADLTNVNIFGVAAWNVTVTAETIQSRLIVQDYNAPAIIVPGLALAQFVYMLMKNSTGLRDSLDAVIRNGVLLLGRFSAERKPVLDALRDHLARIGRLPLMFDFIPLPDRNLAETVLVLAGLCRLVIADITDAKAVAFELTKLNGSLKIPTLLTVTADTRDHEISEMWNDLSENEWVSSELIRYRTPEELIGQVPHMIALGEQLASNLNSRRQQRKLVVRSGQ